MKTRVIYFFFIIFFLSGYVRSVYSSWHSSNRVAGFAIKCNAQPELFAGNQNGIISICDFVLGFEEDDNNVSFIKKKLFDTRINTSLSPFVCLYSNSFCSNKYSGYSCTSPATKKYILQKILKI
jgi:hypothetical protein